MGQVGPGASRGAVSAPRYVTAVDDGVVTKPADGDDAVGSVALEASKADVTAVHMSNLSVLGDPWCVTAVAGKGIGGPTATVPGPTAGGPAQGAAAEEE